MDRNQSELGDVIKRLLKAYKIDDQVNEAQLRSAWVKLMGKAISNKTTQIRLRNKTLYISLSSEVLRQELSYSKEKIKELVNRELGEGIVKEVVMR